MSSSNLVLPTPFPVDAGSVSRSKTWSNAYSIIEPGINAEGKHTWPFDISFPIDVKHLVFDDARIRMKRHDYFEILLGYSGESVFQVQDRYVHIGEGDLFVMGSGIYHRPVRSRPDKSRAIVLYFLPELIRWHEVDAEGTEYLMPFLVQGSGFPHVIHAKTNIPAKILDLIRQIQAELPAASPASRLYVKTYLKMILVLLNKHYANYQGAKEEYYRKQRDLARLRPLFDYMNKHYGERISVPKAASLVYMSKSHFVRFFLDVTGQSFAAYLRNFRVAKAQDLLVMTEKSIGEVGREAGFCDQSHFGMVFRKLVKMTPLQYRHSFIDMSLRGPADATKMADSDSRIALQ